MPTSSLLLDKPRLVEKLREFHKHLRKNDGKIGTKTRGIDLNFNNACNLKCKYCFTNSPKGEHFRDMLPIDVIARLADEADELGLHGNTKTFIWDVKDLDDPVLRSKYVSEQTAIDHNQYIKGEYAYQVC